MLKSVIAAAALALPALAPAATTLTDGSFEVQGAASTTSFCYFDNGAGDGPCLNTPSTGAGAGLQIETNTAWPGIPTADGDYYAFVQGGGVLGQQFTATTGVYDLSWTDAGRPGNGNSQGNQTYNVELRTITSATTFSTLLLGSFATTSGQLFTARSVTDIALTAGSSYVLAFQGINPNGGDNTSFIDAVAFAEQPGGGGAVPEPATWAMLMLGFGLVGAAARRRRGGFAPA